MQTCIVPFGIPQAHAQGLLSLPVPGASVSLTPAFSPATLIGLKIHPENPLRVDFVVDSGDFGLSNQAFKSETEKLIKYFLAALTIPEKDLWVNLSPYEENRIVADNFAQTEMGRDLLAQDYILKQITASLIYPDDELGKEFWKRIYQKAYEEYGTANIPVDAFNKVWIVPKKAVVYENGDRVFVAESSLSVMVEQDYLAMTKHSQGSSDVSVGVPTSDVGYKSGKEVGSSGKVMLETDYVALQAKQQVSSEEHLVYGDNQQPNTISQIPNTDNKLASDIVREIIIPALEKEVNQGKNFAQLRQIYNAVILAAWFKTNLKNALLNEVYSDQSKVSGVDVEDKKITDKIYQRYLEAFKKGVCNFVKVEYDENEHKNVPRKYFSGGTDLALSSSGILEKTNQSSSVIPSGKCALVEQNFSVFSSTVVEKIKIKEEEPFSDILKDVSDNELFILKDILRNLNVHFAESESDLINVEKFSFKNIILKLKKILDKHGDEKNKLDLQDPRSEALIGSIKLQDDGIISIVHPMFTTSGVHVENYPIVVFAQNIAAANYEQVRIRHWINFFREHDKNLDIAIKDGRFGTIIKFWIEGSDALGLKRPKVVAKRKEAYRAKVLEFKQIGASGRNGSGSKNFNAFQSNGKRDIDFEYDDEFVVNSILDISPQELGKVSREQLIQKLASLMAMLAGKGSQEMELSTSKDKEPLWLDFRTESAIERNFSSFELFLEEVFGQEGDKEKISPYKAYFFSKGHRKNGSNGKSFFTPRKIVLTIDRKLLKNFIMKYKEKHAGEGNESDRVYIDEDNLRKYYILSLWLDRMIELFEKERVVERYGRIVVDKEKFVGGRAYSEDFKSFVELKSEKNIFINLDGTIAVYDRESDQKGYRFYDDADKLYDELKTLKDNGFNIILWSSNYEWFIRHNFVRESRHKKWIDLFSFIITQENYRAPTDVELSETYLSEEFADAKKLYGIFDSFKDVSMFGPLNRLILRSEPIYSEQRTAIESRVGDSTCVIGYRGEGIDGMAQRILSEVLTEAEKTQIEKAKKEKLEKIEKEKAERERVEKARLEKIVKEKEQQAKIAAEKKAQRDAKKKEREEKELKIRAFSKDYIKEAAAAEIILENILHKYPQMMFAIRLFSNVYEKAVGLEESDDNNQIVSVISAFFAMQIKRLAYRSGKTLDEYLEIISGNVIDSEGKVTQREEVEEIKILLRDILIHELINDETDELMIEKKEKESMSGDLIIKKMLDNGIPKALGTSAINIEGLLSASQGSGQEKKVSLNKQAAQAVSSLLDQIFDDKFDLDGIENQEKLKKEMDRIGLLILRDSQRDISSKIKHWAKEFQGFSQETILSRWAKYKESQLKNKKDLLKFHVTLADAQKGYLTIEVVLKLIEQMQDIYKKLDAKERKEFSFQEWIDLWDIKIDSFVDNLFDCYRLADGTFYFSKLPNSLHPYFVKTGNNLYELKEASHGNQVNYFDIWSKWVFPVFHNFESVPEAKVPGMLNADVTFFMNDPKRLDSTFYTYNVFRMFEKFLANISVDKFFIFNVDHGKEKLPAQATGIVRYKKDGTRDLVGQTKDFKDKIIKLLSEKRFLQNADLNGLLLALYVLADETDVDLLQWYGQYKIVEDLFEGDRSGNGLSSENNIARARHFDRGVRTLAFYILDKLAGGFEKFTEDSFVDINKIQSSDVVIFKEIILPSEYYNQTKFPVLEMVEGGYITSGVAAQMIQIESMFSLEPRAFNILKLIHGLGQSLIMEPSLDRSVYVLGDQIRAASKGFHPAHFAEDAHRYVDSDGVVFTLEEVAQKKKTKEEFVATNTDSMDLIDLSLDEYARVFENLTSKIDLSVLINLTLEKYAETLTMAVNFSVQRYLPLIKKVIEIRNEYFERYQQYPAISIVSNRDQVPNDAFIEPKEMNNRDIANKILGTGLPDIIPLNGQLVENLAVEHIESLLSSGDDTQVLKPVDSNDNRLFPALAADQLLQIFGIINASSKSMAMINHIARQFQTKEDLEDLLACVLGNFSSKLSYRSSLTANFIVQKGFATNEQMSMAFGPAYRYDSFNPYYSLDNIHFFDIPEYGVPQNINFSYYFDSNEKAILYQIAENKGGHEFVRYEYSGSKRISKDFVRDRKEDLNSDIAEVLIALDRLANKTLDFADKKYGDFKLDVEKEFGAKIDDSNKYLFLEKLLDAVLDALQETEISNDGEFLDMLLKVERGVVLAKTLIETRNSMDELYPFALENRVENFEYIEKRIEESKEDQKINMYIEQRFAGAISENFRALIEGLLQSSPRIKVDLYILSDDPNYDFVPRNGNQIVDPYQGFTTTVVRSLDELEVIKKQDCLHVGLNYDDFENPQDENIFVVDLAHNVQGELDFSLKRQELSTRLNLDLDDPSGSIPINPALLKRKKIRNEIWSLDDLLRRRGAFLDKILTSKQLEVLQSSVDALPDGKSVFNVNMSVLSYMSPSNLEKFLEEMSILRSAILDDDLNDIFISAGEEHGKQIVLLWEDSGYVAERLDLKKLTDDIGITVIDQAGEVYPGLKEKRIPVTIIRCHELSEKQRKELFSELAGTAKIVEKDLGNGKGKSRFFVDFPIYISGMSSKFFNLLSTGSMFIHDNFVIKTGEMKSYLQNILRRAFAFESKDRNNGPAIHKAEILVPDMIMGGQAKNSRIVIQKGSHNNEIKTAATFGPMFALGKYSDLVGRTLHSQSIAETFSNFSAVEDLLCGIAGRIIEAEDVPNKSSVFIKSKADSDQLGSAAQPKEQPSSSTKKFFPPKEHSLYAGFMWLQQNSPEYFNLFIKKAKNPNMVIKDKSFIAAVTDCGLWNGKDGEAGDILPEARQFVLDSIKASEDEAGNFDEGADVSSSAISDHFKVDDQGHIKYVDENFKENPTIKLDFEMIGFRHMITFANEQGILQGGPSNGEDNKLSEEGKRQATEDLAPALYAMLKEKIEQGKKIVIALSEADRTIESIQPFINFVKETLGIDLEVKVYPQSNERSFGNYEGKTLSEFQESDSETYIKVIKKFDSTAKIGGGESDIDALSRSYDFLQALKKEYDNTDTTVVLVNHGMFLLACLANLGHNRVADENENINFWKFDGTFPGHGEIINLSDPKSDYEKKSGIISAYDPKASTGGIDFSSDKLDLETRGQGIDFTIPDELRNIDWADVDGLVPMIIEIIPLVNFQGFVRGEDEAEFLKEQDLAYFDLTKS
ncbi:MAG: phosphoglycerate mutase family protein [Candidatus Omnitrophica bacterium]|nr:phosphoglycerate mutase family protein [Candidatus Omnitrophota bacterium]